MVLYIQALVKLHKMKLLHKLIFKKIVVLLGDNYAKIFVFHKKKVIDNIIIKKISDKDEMKSLVDFLINNLNYPFIWF